MPVLVGAAHNHQPHARTNTLRGYSTTLYCCRTFRLSRPSHTAREGEAETDMPMPPHVTVSCHRTWDAAGSVICLHTQQVLSCPVLSRSASCFCIVEEQACLHHAHLRQHGGRVSSAPCRATCMRRCNTLPIPHTRRHVAVAPMSWPHMWTNTSRGQAACNAYCHIVAKQPSSDGRKPLGPPANIHLRFTHHAHEGSSSLPE